MNHFSQFLIAEKSANLKKLAFAVSGGADSMYMTMKMLPQCINQGVSAAVLVVDHGLRAESTNEALWVKQYLESKFLSSSSKLFKVEILNLKFHKKPSANIQEIARNMRYDALIGYCNSNNIKHLFLAHNLDDQAETIFMRIARGSGIDGACGISDVVQRDGVYVHRPILCTPRKIIENELSLQGWKWVEDPSNQDDRYQRVKVRKLLRSYDNYPQLIERFNLFAQNVRRAQSFIDQAMQNEFTKCVRIDPLEYVQVDLARFTVLHQELQFRILTKIINYINCTPLKQRLNSLSELVDKICNVSRETSENPKSASNFSGATLGGCEFMIKHNILYVFRELNKVKSQVPNLNARDGFEYFGNRFRILQSDASVKHKVGCLGFKGYCWLKNRIPLPKLVNSRIFQGLPAVFDVESSEIIAVYMLYGNWEKYFARIKCM